MSLAHLKIGELSRGGKSRGEKAPEAHDHDTEVKAILIPFGILEARVGWVEAIAETHHHSRRRMMGFALLYPSYYLSIVIPIR